MFHVNKISHKPYLSGTFSGFWFLSGASSSGLPDYCWGGTGVLTPRVVSTEIAVEGAVPIIGWQGWKYQLPIGVLQRHSTGDMGAPHSSLSWIKSRSPPPPPPQQTWLEWMRMSSQLLLMVLDKSGAVIVGKFYVLTGCLFSSPSTRQTEQVLVFPGCQLPQCCVYDIRGRKGIQRNSPSHHSSSPVVLLGDLHSSFQNTLCICVLYHVQDP